MNKLNEDSSFNHNQRKLIKCGSMYRAQRGRGPPALTPDWLPLLVLSAHSTREQYGCWPEHFTLPCLLNISVVNSGEEKCSSSNRLAKFLKSCLSKPCFVEIAFPYAAVTHMTSLRTPRHEPQCSPCLTSFLPQESTENLWKPTELSHS